MFVVQCPTGGLFRAQASPSKVDPMSTTDPPQTPSSRDFPVEWYDSAPEDHFWMTWRIRVILRHLRRLKIDGRAALKGFDVGCGHGAVQRQLHSATHGRLMVAILTRMRFPAILGTTGTPSSTIFLIYAKI
jgi:hypothetical protein